METKNVAALVLAAGLSTRMGTFKPLLSVGGRTLIERVIGTYRAAAIEKILVVTGHRAGDMTPVLARAGAQGVFNPRYREEMLLSVKAGIADLEEGLQAFFLHPGDIPFVGPGVVQRLLEACPEKAVDLVRPRFRGKTGHPVLISGARIPSILDFEGEGGLRSLVQGEAWSVFDVECDDPGILADLDDPEDWRKALEAQPR